MVCPESAQNIPQRGYPCAIGEVVDKDVSLNARQKHCIKMLSKKSSTLGLLLYLKNIFLIAAVILLNYYFENIILLLVSILYIGARQHSLYELNHDAAHGSLFETHKLNKAFATVFSNLTFFHHPEAFSYVQWRRVHLLHHGFLFTSMDPNYVERQLQGETERVFNRRDLALEMLLAGYRSLRNFFLGKQDYVFRNGRQFEKRKFNHLSLLVRWHKDDPEMNRERLISVLFFAGTLCTIHVLGAWKLFFLLWLVPMYTTYPAILRFMDLSDHDWTESSTNPLKNTRSSRGNVFDRLFVSDLNRSYHLEHHLFPPFQGVRVARLSRFLQKQQIIGIPRNGLLFCDLKLQHAREGSRVSLTSELKH